MSNEPTSPSQVPQRASRGWEHPLVVFGSVLGAIITIFVGYHGLNVFIDNRIESKISDSEYLTELARKVRPSVIFDINSSVLADMGAMEYLDSIIVSMDKERIEIIVRPTVHLGIEPVLESLDASYNIETARGPKYDWIFRLHAPPPYIAIERRQPDPAPLTAKRFRLEIIR